MSPHIPRRVVIWTDHQKAILVTFVREQLAGKEEVLSSAGPHTHGGGWAQHHIEAHRHEVLKHFYEEVIHHLGPVDEILILGPGQAKHDLHRSIEHHKGLKGKVMAVVNASRLTERELIAEAERFFRAENNGSKTGHASSRKE